VGCNMYLPRYLFVILTLMAIIPALALAGEWQRPARLAGSWYPGDPQEIDRSIGKYLQAKNQSPPVGKLVALIAPHAGHIYSGATAGKAWSFAKKTDPASKTVILLGPSHYYPLSAPSIWPKGSLETPLGPLEVDQDIARELAQICQADFYREAHLKEHCLEVQLPFIKKTLPTAKVVTLLTGRPDLENARKLGSALAQVSKGRSVLLAASSDLSHYHTLAQAQVLDNRVAAYVRKLDPAGLLLAYRQGRVEACGVQAMAAVMFAALEMRAGKGIVLGQTTSASTNKDTSKVVGYLAAALMEQPQNARQSPNGLNEKQVAQLLELAKDSLQACVKGKKLPSLINPDMQLRQKRAVFITLNKAGRLRGCIGHMQARQPLYQAVINMTRAAALQDPRFMPVSRDELDDISISISVLTPMVPVKPREVQVGRDGLLIRHAGRTGVLLPQVPVELNWDREQYLDGLCRKAGLPRGAWREEGVDLWRFEAEVLK
jgi:AmmeMemoRadiSam system protein B/AmmeMemoRadiSam system protein A